MLVVAQAGLAGGGDALSVEQRFARAHAGFVAAQEKLTAVGGDSLEARRMFREAADQFAALARDGVCSANLYVNAGNAFHFAKDEPRALLWYLRADRLAPTAEVRSGLASLRRVCKADLWPPPKPSVGRVLMFWHYDLGPRLKQAVLLTFYPAGCAAFIIGFFSLRRKAWQRAGLALLILGGVMGISDLVAGVQDQPEWAVVLERSKGLAGDGPMYSTVVDSIVPGQEVRLLERRGDWAQVELPSGTRCWLPAGHCEAVRLDKASAS